MHSLACSGLVSSVYVPSVNPDTLCNAFVVHSKHSYKQKLGEVVSYYFAEHATM